MNEADDKITIDQVLLGVLHIKYEYVVVTCRLYGISNYVADQILGVDGERVIW